MFINYNAPISKNKSESDTFYWFKNGKVLKLNFISEITKYDENGFLIPGW